MQVVWNWVCYTWFGSGFSSKGSQVSWFLTEYWDYDHYSLILLFTVYSCFCELRVIFFDPEEQRVFRMIDNTIIDLEIWFNKNWWDLDVDDYADIRIDIFLLKELRKIMLGYGVRMR